MTRWTADDVSRVSGVTDLSAQRTWIRTAMGAGFDLLTKNGATIVWYPAALTADDIVQPERAQFGTAMADLLVARKDLRQRDATKADFDAVLADLHTYGRRTASDAASA